MIMNSYGTFHDLLMQIWIYVYGEYCEIIPEIMSTKVHWWPLLTTQHDAFFKISMKSQYFSQPVARYSSDMISNMISIPATEFLRLFEIKRGNQENCKLFSSFRARDFRLTKLQTEIFRFRPKSHTNRGILKSEMWQISSKRTHPRFLTVHYFCRWLTSQIHIRHFLIWRDDPFEILRNFFQWHFPAFTQAIANIQYPFNNNVALINLNGNFVSIWHCHLSSTSTDNMSSPTFSWTCAFIFIEIKWWLLL